MRIKKMIRIAALAGIGGIGLFGFLLYATVKTKSANLDGYEPFKKWIGKTVTLLRQTTLFEERGGVIPDDACPYRLLDSLHPQWQYVEQLKGLPQPDLAEITRFPAGTKLKIEKAIQYTNGVSGLSYPALFGTIHIGNRRYEIAYQWGKMDIGKKLDRIDKCWQFHQAPWQVQADTTYYALPEAKLW